MVDVVFILRGRVLSFPEDDGREYRIQELMMLDVVFAVWGLRVFARMMTMVEEHEPGIDDGCHSFAFRDDDDELIRVFMSFYLITVLREDGGCSKAAAV